MQITWLGQAGLLLETRNKKILIDPYLSNSVAKIQSQNFRRQPIDKRFLCIVPDIIVITHNHPDHLDKETLCFYLNENSRVLVLAPNGAWQELRKFGGLKNNYVLFNNGTIWTEDTVVFRAVKAEHSDEYAIGVIISEGGKNYYITGDTLYNERIFLSLPDIPIEAVFLPINGLSNNMNMRDAVKFAAKVGAKYTIPIHFAMFDTIDAKKFGCKNRRIPQIYRKIYF